MNYKPRAFLSTFLPECLLAGIMLLAPITAQAANWLHLAREPNAHIAGADYQLVLAKQVVLSNGLVKNKYLEHYRGLPVFNAIVTSSEIQGRQQDFYGSLLQNIHQDIIDINPKFSQADILAQVKKQYALKPEQVPSHDKAELFVRLNEYGKAELIYLVSFNLEGERPARPFFLLNANTGKIIQAWDGLTTQQAEGPGGNEKIGAYYYGRDFGPLEVSGSCELKNKDVETYDMGNQTRRGVLFRFDCPVNRHKFVNGAYSPLNDAHYFGGVVFKMYRDWYAMSPLDSVFKLRVHYGNHYQNAFWDGRQMTFGDGGRHTYPFTSLDVMAHEVTHGVTEKNANLAYVKQSGGINESFSDMAGETALFYLYQQVGKSNAWLAGEAIIKGPPGTALRYFKNPPDDGISIDNARDYRDGMDVHHTSGVYNKAFYTLATKPNWGVRKAFEIFLNANRLYWTQEASFISAACGVVNAAMDLDYEVSDVIASFRVVGVDTGGC